MAAAVLALVSIFLIVSAQAASAASITWTEIVVDSTDGDSDPGAGLGDAAVSVNGALVEAANFGTLVDYTVNGVLFNGIDFSVAPTNLSIGYDSADNLGDGAITGTSAGGAIDNLTTSFGRDAGVSANNATLTGLTIGQQYEVQFLASFSGLNRTTTFDDGAGAAIVLTTNNPHSFATGVFTADEATQAVNFTASSGSQFLSGYQLRAVDLTAETSRIIVNTDTGAVTLAAGDDTFAMDYYELTSLSGALNQSGWVSLDDQNHDAVDGNDGGDTAGDSLLEGWDETGGVGDDFLAEVFLRESSTLSPGQTLSLGHAFDTSNPPGDLVFQYNQADSGLLSLPIETVTGFGDMNGDGAIDQQDINPFVLTLTDRPAFELQYPGVDADIAGDVNGDGAFNLGDVGAFKSLLAQSTAAAAQPAPEPSTLLLTMISVALLLVRCRRSRELIDAH